MAGCAVGSIADLEIKDGSGALTELNAAAITLSSIPARCSITAI